MTRQGRYPEELRGRAARMVFEHQNELRPRARQLSLGDLLEGIVLHAFEHKAPFDDATIQVIQQLKQVYGLDLTDHDSHHLHSADQEQPHASVQARPPDRHHPGAAPTQARHPPVHPDR